MGFLSFPLHCGIISSEFWKGYGTIVTVKTLPVQEAFVLVEELDLPPEYAWFNELDAEERSEFFKGLLEILTARKEISNPWLC